MTRMTGPDCAVMCNFKLTHTHIMCNLINTHTHTHTPWEDQCEWHRMTRMTRPDCAVMCNLINTEREREREKTIPKNKNTEVTGGVIEVR